MHEWPPIKQDLSPIRQFLVASQDISATIIPLEIVNMLIMWFIGFYRYVGLLIFFSPLTACIALSITVRASPWEESVSAQFSKSCVQSVWCLYL